MRVESQVRSETKNAGKGRRSGQRGGRNGQLISAREEVGAEGGVAQKVGAMEPHDGDCFNRKVFLVVQQSKRETV